MNLQVTGELAGLDMAIWLETLLNMTLKGSALLLLAAGLAWLIPAHHPARRSRLWSATFGLLLLLPLVSHLPLPDSRASITSPDGLSPVAMIELIQAPDVHGDADGIGSSTTPDPGPGGSRRPHRAWPLLVGVWMAGVGFLLIRAVRRYRCGLLRALAGSAPLIGEHAALLDRLARGVGYGGAPRAVFSSRATAPFVTGLWRPLLVLPGELASWPSSRLEPVLVHELAHAARRDVARLLLMELVCALYWFHPLVRIAARRAGHEQEMACDQMVCRTVPRTSEYARLLLRFATGPQPGAGAWLARESGLEKRVRSIIDFRHLPHRPVRCWRSVCGLLCFPPSVVVLLWLGLIGIGESPRVDAATAFPSGDQQTAVAPTTGPAGSRAPICGIHQASRMGDSTTVMQWLVQDPSLIDARDEKGMTPLALAAWHDHPGLSADLLQLGANPEIRNHNGLTPLFSALDRGRLQTARLLVEHGADITARGYHGRTMLHMAARAGDWWTIDHLLAAGADIDARDTEGLTPLDLAVISAKAATVSYLAQRGATPSGRISPRPAIKAI